MKKLALFAVLLNLVVSAQILHAVPTLDNSITSLINNFHDADSPQRCNGIHNYKWCLYPSSSYQTDDLGYWHVANIMETLANYVAKYPNNETLVAEIKPLIQESAQYDPSVVDVNPYYDDKLWWVLAALDVYTVYKNLKIADADTYYNAAKKTFDHLNTTEVDNVCDGGIYWNGSHFYKNAITNELFFMAAAKLAYINYKENNLENAKKYLTIANKQWNWLTGTHNKQKLITQNLVNLSLGLIPRRSRRTIPG